jgi:eukaryotic translation initiation factor 2C
VLKPIEEDVRCADSCFWLFFSRFLEADTSQRDYDPGPILAALNLVLSMQASRTGVRVGKNRHFFTPEEQR